MNPILQYVRRRSSKKRIVCTLEDVVEDALGIVFGGCTVATLDGVHGQRSKRAIDILLWKVVRIWMEDGAEELTVCP